MSECGDRQVGGDTERDSGGLRCIASAILASMAVAATIASVSAGCTQPSTVVEPLTPRGWPEREEASKEPTIEAPDSTQPDSENEMPAAVATSASTCHGFRIGEELEPARLISAERLDTQWVVAMEGLWAFHMPPNPLPPGYPTREPWMDTYLAVWCKLTIDTHTGHLESMEARTATATPPGVQEQ